MWSLPTARRAIILAGCLGTIYTQFTTSPATVQFARSLGGGGWHIGILGALPQAMLMFQFLAAVLANHLRHRRRAWLTASLVQRTVLIPVAFGPWLLPEVDAAVWLWALIAATAADQALGHFGGPLWLSWMGDYLPREGMTRYWGLRHAWMQWAGAAALLATALLLFRTGWDTRTAYSVIVGIAVVSGVIDLLLFLKVEEPPASRNAAPRLAQALVAPFQNVNFRKFISYSCFWHFAAMLGAPFISMYLLVEVGMNLYDVLILWAASWVGGAILSQRVGHWTEEFGNRPMLVLCTAAKSVLMLALVITPREPTLVFWVMIPILAIDSALNAGIAIATNGFLLRHSPAENRAMYIAAGSALAGIVGGVTSVVAGGILSRLLAALGSEGVQLLGMHFSGFHILFLASMLMRVASIGYARRIQEPESSGARRLAVALVAASPLRLIRLPGQARPMREETSQERPDRRAA